MLGDASPRQNPFTGRRCGDFVLREQIGEGGFGAVYRAEQQLLDREAVVKISLADTQKEQERVGKFLQEARIASRIDHPFAAHVYAFGAETDGLLWIAMELVRGTSLAELLANGSLPLERAIPLLTRLCEVVHTLHEQGIIHRDIKPENVMVISRSGTMFPKLLDLGIASEFQNGGVSAERPAGVGTPLYMAPEQWVASAPITPATDVYALGALTYEVLTGAPPFTGVSVMDVARQHARAVPKRLPDTYASDLADAVSKALAKRPRERFASALAYGEALRDASGLAIEAVGLPQLDPATRDEVVMSAPQPIAESLAAMEAARTPAQLRAALWNVVAVVVSYVGNIALAVRQRSQGRVGDAPQVTAHLQSLVEGGLSNSQWWSLTRELVRPFAGKSALYPIPELVDLFFEQGVEVNTALDALLASKANEPPQAASADELRTFLVGAIHLCGRSLRTLRFLHNYTLAVSHQGIVEEWMGVRRPLRLEVATAGQLDASVALLGISGTFVCNLDPVASCAAPSPGAPRELFWLAGGVHGGARLLALPGALELRRDDVWRLHQLSAASEAHNPINAPDAAPYLGLQTFTADQAHLYFGREAEVIGFMNRLQGRRWIAVVGPSGSGKSSFIQAGVLPNLQEVQDVVVMRPGGQPLEALSHALKQVGVELPARALEHDPNALPNALHGRASTRPLMLIVDQFEELVTQCLDEARRAAFAAAIVALSEDAAAKGTVIVTLRDDFLLRVAQITTLRDRLATSLHLVTTPNEEDLRRILTEPARRFGYAFEDEDLVAQIAQEVSQQSAALALLSFTASQLWQFRDKHFHRMTRAAYQTLGGVGGALAHHAESILSSLNEQEGRIVREVFRHLVTADGTRASLSRSELLDVTGGGAPAERVIETLIGARLLVAQEDGENRERIEVIHEALLAAWPRLVAWRHEDAESARLRDQLRVAAKQWQERGRNRSLLWRGDALTEYRLWRARYPGNVTQVEQHFADASLADERRTRRLRRAAATILLSGLVITTIVFAQLRSVAETNRQRVSRGLTQSYVEQGRRAALGGDMANSLLFLGAATLRNSPDAGVPYMLSLATDSLRAEVTTLDGGGGKIWAASYAPDGATLLTANDDGAIRIWDAQTNQMRTTFGTPQAAGRIVADWIDNNTVVVGSRDGTLRVWNVAKQTVVATDSSHRQELFAMKWNPRSQSVITASHDKTARSWNPNSGASTVLYQDATTSDFPFALAVAPTSGVVAIAIASVDGDRGAALVVPATGKPRRLHGSHGAIDTLSFSRDETRLATSGTDGAITIWDVATNQVHQTLLGHDGGVVSLAWSSDGKRLISGSVDMTVRSWDLVNDASQILRGHSAAVSNLRFSNDQLYFVSSDDGGTVRIWETARGILVGTQLHGGLISALAMAPTATQYASASSLGTVKIWRLEAPDLLRTLPQAINSDENEERPLITADGRLFRAFDRGVDMWTLPTGATQRLDTQVETPGRIALLDGGETLAHWSQTGVISFYDAHTLTKKADVPETINNLTLIKSSARGDQFVAGTADGALYWYTATGTRIATSQTTGAIMDGVWSADGSRLLVSSGQTGSLTVTLYDAATRNIISTLPNQWRMAKLAPSGEFMIAIKRGDPLATLWSSEGTMLASMKQSERIEQIAITPQSDKAILGLSDGNAAVWSVPSGALLKVMGGHGTRVADIIISPHGERAYCLNDRGEVKAWELTTYKQIAHISVDAASAWLIPSPTEEYLVTLNASQQLDRRWLRLRTQAELTPAFVEESVCKLPTAVRLGLDLGEENPLRKACDK